MQRDLEKGIIAARERKTTHRVPHSAHVIGFRMNDGIPNDKEIIIGS